MRIICLECPRELGEKLPFEDPSETHTICRECMERRLIETRRQRLKRRFAKTVSRGA